MICIMHYCVTTPKRGLVLKPFGEWDGISTDCKFELMVKMDSEYAKCLDARRSMTRSAVYMNGVPVTFRNSFKKAVSLSMTEAELNTAVMEVQDALFTRKHFEIAWTEG